MREIIGKNKSVALEEVKHSFFFSVSTEKKHSDTDIINPPIVPAANGNQNSSFSAPTIKGINPKTIEATVRKIGIIFVFHAFT